MYAIASKFEDQKRFILMDVRTGEQVGKWMYATLFKCKEDAEQCIEKIKSIAVNGVEFTVKKYR